MKKVSTRDGRFAITVPRIHQAFEENERWFEEYGDEWTAGVFTEEGEVERRPVNLAAPQNPDYRECRYFRNTGWGPEITHIVCEYHVAWGMAFLRSVGFEPRGDLEVLHGFDIAEVRNRDYWIELFEAGISPEDRAIRRVRLRKLR